MAEKIKEIFDHINQKNELLDQIQQKYLIFNGQGQSDFNAVAHA